MADTARRPWQQCSLGDGLQRYSTEVEGDMVLLQPFLLLLLDDETNKKTPSNEPLTSRRSRGPPPSVPGTTVPH